VTRRGQWRGCLHAERRPRSRCSRRAAR
jgi:hypothetical protein